MVFIHNVILVLCKISFHESIVKMFSRIWTWLIMLSNLVKPTGLPTGVRRHDHVPSQKRSTLPLEQWVNGEHTEQTVSTHWTEFGEWWANAERKRSAKQTHDEQTLYVNAMWTQECGKINDLYWVPRELSLHYVSR